MMTDVAQSMFDASLRFHKLIWLAASAADSEATTDDFDEFCECLPEGEDDPLYEALPCLKRFASNEDYPEPVEVAFSLITSRKTGFLAQAETPVFSFSPNDIASFSWGHTRLKWLYGDTLEAVADAALLWAEECRTAEKAKAAA